MGSGLVSSFSFETFLGFPPSSLFSSLFFFTYGTIGVERGVFSGFSRGAHFECIDVLSRGKNKIESGGTSVFLVCGARQMRERGESGRVSGAIQKCHKNIFFTRKMSSRPIIKHLKRTGCGRKSEHFLRSRVANDPVKTLGLVNQNAPRSRDWVSRPTKDDIWLMRNPSKEKNETFCPESKLGEETQISWSNLTRFIRSSILCCAHGVKMGNRVIPTRA